MISFPLAGHIKAGGMTPQALESALKSRLQKNYSGDLDVTVSLGEVNKEVEAESKPRFYVTGEVQKPGPYLLDRSINIVQAISQAGGWEFLLPNSASRSTGGLKEPFNLCI